MRFSELEVNNFYYADPVRICPLIRKSNYMIAIADLGYGDGWQAWEWTAKEWNTSPFEEEAYETGDSLHEYLNQQQIIETIFSPWVK